MPLRKGQRFPQVTCSQSISMKYLAAFLLLAIALISVPVEAAYPTQIFLTANPGTGNQTWTVPVDWNSANNTIECIGAGGDGGVQAGSGGGGGGGAYAKVFNLSLTPGATITYSVGGDATTTAGGNGAPATGVSAEF